MFMSEIEEYKKLGFMCGLEIHQRLDTKEKLFCSCSTDTENETHIFTVARSQRAVAGELGKIDPSAIFEQNRKRKFVYNLFRNTTCLVDIDEEPPHEINNEALMLGMSMAKSLNMHIFAELEPMRKEVVDGSDPSAFQRTIMIGVGGFVESNGYKVGIPSLFIEEESSGTETSSPSEVTYNVSRLGIPLIEIDTEPTIPTPKAAKEIALHIGTLLRITGKVKRGLGTIRQDVNISIKGGSRVEIKGLQDISLIDKFIENEVRRQKELLEISNELKKRKAGVKSISDVTDIFRNTSVMLIKNKLEKEGIVLAFGLENFRGILGKEINPDRRLGSEISDYAKSAGSKGIIHSDENLDKYGFKDSELQALRQKLELGDKDSFILVAEDRSIAPAAIKAAMERSIESINGVPKETRMAVNDGLGTSKFLRPLPGGSRMYPETDVLPTSVTKSMLSEAESVAPNLEKKLSVLKKELKDSDLAERVLKSPMLQLYEKITSNTNADKKFVANTLLQKFTELSRNGFTVNAISERRLIELFNIYSEGIITKQAIDEILKIISREDMNIKLVIDKFSFGKISGAKLKKVISEFNKEKYKDLNMLKKAIMEKYRINIDGEELNKLIDTQ